MRVRTGAAAGSGPLAGAGALESRPAGDPAVAPVAPGSAALSFDPTPLARAAKKLGLNAAGSPPTPLESQTWSALGAAVPRYPSVSGPDGAFAKLALGATLAASVRSSGGAGLQAVESRQVVEAAARCGMVHVAIAEGTAPHLLAQSPDEQARRRSVSRALLGELTRTLFEAVPLEIAIREVPDLVRALVKPETPEAAERTSGLLERALQTRTLRTRAQIFRPALRAGHALGPADSQRVGAALAMADTDPARAMAQIEDLLGAAEAFLARSKGASTRLPRSSLAALRGSQRPDASTPEERLARAQVRLAELEAEVAHAPAPTETERFQGALVGLALGDALGGPIEFMSREEIRAQHGLVTDLIGGGWLDLRPGEYTDDTQMAERLARSIVAQRGFVVEDVADRFVAWLDTGPKDVGGLTRQALELRRLGVDPEQAGLIPWVLSGFENSGNGSLMRAAPGGLLTAFREPQEIARVARASSAVTHADPRATSATAALNLAIALLVRGEPDVTERAAAFVADECPEVAAAIRAVKTMPLEEVRTTGYSVDTVQAAFWALEHATNFVDGIVKVTNLGDDADTAGATAGSLLGAKFGLQGIPASWRAVLQNCDGLEALADQLHTLAKENS